MGADQEQIEFRCEGCQSRFRVPASLGGRKGRCKKCGLAIVVPSSQAAPMPVSAPVPAPAAPVIAATPTNAAVLRPVVPSPPAPKVPMRLRRLRSDTEAMRKAFGAVGPIRLQELIGEPAESYKLEYHIKGLVREGDNEPTERATHLVQIELTSDYPRVSPKCTILTPIFHPNIADGVICVGDHWTAGERLPDLAIRIGEIIAYQAYNIQSPLDAEAAMWADLNHEKLPVDSRPLQVV